MGDNLMIRSIMNGNDGNVIDIEGNSTKEGAFLDAYPPKVARSLEGPVTFAANQTWQVLRDPAGSSHHIIQNPQTGHCINISANSQNPDAPVDVYPAKTSNNENQLWDFLPDEFGSGGYFIQNPQTGYVIEIRGASTAAGAALLVNPRRLFGNSQQLWYGVNESYATVPLPALQLAGQPSGFGSDNQYLFVLADQNDTMKSVTVVVDIIEDLAADTWSLQINCDAPAPVQGVSDTQWDAQWMQYGVIMQNNSLALLQQVWHALGPDQHGDPLASETTYSPAFMQLHNNTVPAGTKIVLTLTIDHNRGNFLTGITGQAFNGTTSAGQGQTWTVVGQPSFNPPNVVQESDLAPIGAFSVCLVGPPGGNTDFSSGLGTITVKCDPEVAISNAINGPNPHGNQTAEQSNCHYGQVQQGPSTQIVEPFGVVSPRFTGAFWLSVTGTGLYPNSDLKVSGRCYSNAFAGQVPVVAAAQAKTGNDGSFSVDLKTEKSIPSNSSFDLNVTLVDQQSNEVTGQFIIEPHGPSSVASSTAQAGGYW